MSNENFNVDFIGIGMAKSASSWIFKCLVEHPEICGSNPKEVNYFSNKFSYGEKWYMDCYKHCDKNSVKGEFSTSYITDENAMERIKKRFPDMKLIAIFRKPIDKILSGYYYGVQRGKYSHTLEEHVEKAMNDKVLYFKSLKKCIDIFPRENVLILLHDDIKKDPALFMKKIYKYLGVDDEFQAESATRKVNKTRGAETRFLSLARGIFRLRSRVIANKNQANLRRIARSLGLNKLFKYILSINKKNSVGEVKKEVPSNKIVEKFNNYVRNDIISFGEYIERDLSHWL